MSKIKIVTAFFDIGRSEYNVCKRTNDQYFEYFKFWARIQNQLIVYCEKQDADRILDIRRQYGLEDKTTVITLDDVWSIEPEIYQRMVKVENSDEFQNFRYRYGDPSNKAKYNYIMLLKWWCVADTAKKSNSDEFIAWLDFGYNHGGDRYTKSEDFDFLWDFDFDSKINVFCLSNPDKVSLLDSLQFQLDCFIGHTAIISQPLCDKYWGYMKEAMLTLLDIECMDDDQYLQLMAYKKHADEHKVVICDWFEDFQKCSNKTFTVKNVAANEPVNKKRISLFKKIKNKLARLKNTFIKSQRIASGKIKPEDLMNPFCKRMYEKEKKYYG